MPEYLAPGVYTEEISTGPVPIEGVSTSTTGMAGPTPRGPVRPRLVTSWLEFQLWYGGLPAPASPFAYTAWAAKGFFDNGGQRLYMARVCGAGAKAASLELAGPNPLTIQSVGPGAFAGQLFVRVARAGPANPTRPGCGSASCSTRPRRRYRSSIRCCATSRRCVIPTAASPTCWKISTISWPLTLSPSCTGPRSSPRRSAGARPHCRRSRPLLPRSPGAIPVPLRSWPTTSVIRRNRSPRERAGGPGHRR